MYVPNISGDLLQYCSVMFYRSLCTLVCKWTYCPPEGWDATFWSSIGLEDLLENNFSKIGKRNEQTSSKLIVYYKTSENIAKKLPRALMLWSFHAPHLLFKLCCFLPSRQCDVSSREPVGRRSHPGGSSRYGFGPRNCSWCFSH